jgi:WD40-like Beta Propeller Repeat
MNKSLSVAELFARGVELRPFEAVAIVQALIRAEAADVGADVPVGPPTLSTVRLAENGTVTCCSCGIPPNVAEVALLLSDMLRETGATGGGGLRYTVARALQDVDAPPFKSLVDFSRALERYEQDEPAEILRDVWIRASSVRRGSGKPPAFRRYPERRRTMPSATALRRDLREADLKIYELLTATAAAPAPPRPAPERSPRAWTRRAAPAAVVLAVVTGSAIHRWASSPGEQQMKDAPRSQGADESRAAANPSDARAANASDASRLAPDPEPDDVPPMKQQSVVRAVDAGENRYRPVSLPSFASDETPMFLGESVPDDLRVVTIVENGARNHHGQASPDGTRIAFDSDRDGERGVYVAARDGTNVRRVSGPGTAAMPRWAPDGDRLAFIHEEQERPGVLNLWLHTLTTGETVRLTDFQSSRAGGAAWFPDGRRICYAYEDRLVVLDLDDGDSREYVTPLRGRQLRTPAVSPDGLRVIFQVAGHGAWLLDLTDGSMRVVLTDPTADEFAWSPDGRRVAFHSEQSGGWGIWFTAGS